MPALYGAAGVIHNPELTRVLLEAGANADDGESPYHSTEARDPECLRLVLEYGGNPEPIVLAHALDYDHPEHVKVLLAAGADASELLPFAVRRGRGPEILRLLVDARRAARGARRRGVAQAGAAPHGVPARGAARARRLRAGPRRARRGHARRRRRPRGGRDRPRRAPGDGPDRPRLRPAGGADPVRARATGWRTSSTSTGRTSAASSAARRRAHCSSTSAGSATPSTRGSWSAPAPRSATALEWCVHGSQHHAIAGRDYVGVAEALGAVIEERHLEQADGPLAEWLEARLRP